MVQIHQSDLQLIARHALQPSSFVYHLQRNGLHLERRQETTGPDGCQLTSPGSIAKAPRWTWLTLRSLSTMTG